MKPKYDATVNLLFLENACSVNMIQIKLASAALGPQLLGKMQSSFQEPGIKAFIDGPKSLFDCSIDISPNWSLLDVAEEISKVLREEFKVNSILYKVKNFQRHYETRTYLSIEEMRDVYEEMRDVY